MLSIVETERIRLVVVTDAEIRKTQSHSDSIVEEFVFSYLNEKVPNLPKDIFSLGSFDHESGLLSSEHIKSSSLDLWSARLLEPDATVPGRSWSVELTVGQVNERTLFGSRLSCFSRHLDFYFDPAVPRVYRDLVAQNILFGDGIKLSRSPIDVESEDDAAWLLALIKNPRRRRNIIVLSSDDAGICSINPNFFSNRLCGVAHVVRIFPGAAFQISDAIGKYLSVFDSGIRIYRPTSDIESDDPLNHTLFTRHRLARVDPTRVQHSIAMDAFRTSVDFSLKAQPFPTFIQIRSANTNFKLAETSTSKGTGEIDSLMNQLRASQNARIAAESQAREALDMAIQEENSRKTIEAERNQERARSMALAARIRALEGKQDFIVGSKIRPKSYDEVADWVEREFAGRLKMHARALRGLKNAAFENLDLVCDLLEFLAIFYVDGKRGDRNAWIKFENGCKDKGVDYSKSISDSRAGEQGAEYFVVYRGEREFLEWHLKRGNSRDPRKDLRIYFFWDDEDEEVIVGSLPDHLDTRIT